MQFFHLPFSCFSFFLHDWGPGFWHRRGLRILIIFYSLLLLCSYYGVYWLDNIIKYSILAEIMISKFQNQKIIIKNKNIYYMDGWIWKKKRIIQQKFCIIVYIFTDYYRRFSDIHRYFVMTFVSLTKFKRLIFKLVRWLLFKVSKNK